MTRRNPLWNSTSVPWNSLAYAHTVYQVASRMLLECARGNLWSGFNWTFEFSKTNGTNGLSCELYLQDFDKDFGNYSASVLCVEFDEFLSSCLTFLNCFTGDLK